LRLDYILERLKTDEDLLQIDVKEIANEAGFRVLKVFRIISRENSKLNLLILLK
jgi:hypothetical protein